MHLILTGATGLVGSGVLDAMVRAKDITKISILSRRPVPFADDLKDPRINVILHKDFERYDADVLRQLEGARGCVWALGISQSLVDKEEYVRITKNYALAAAKSFATLRDEANSGTEATNTKAEQKEPFRFVYVSGEGATQNPGPFSALYARVKGETEQELADLSAQMPPGSLEVVSARPAFVDAAQHKAIAAYVPVLGLTRNAMTVVLGPPIRAFWKSFVSPTDALGRFLTDVAAGKVGDDKLEGRGAFRLGGDGSSSSSWVVENVGFRRVMGL